MNLSIPKGGIVLGIGADLVECDRVARVYERQGERLLHRVFTQRERDYCLQMRNPVPHLAARFAAKEAVSKAFGTGIGTELGWTSIEIIHGPRGEPLVQLDPKGSALLHARHATSVIITLSHTHTLAQAIALLLR